MNISKETIDRIEHAFNLMGTYILYIKEQNQTIHYEADGKPSCEKALQDAKISLNQDQRCLN